MNGARASLKRLARPAPIIALTVALPALVAAVRAGVQRWYPTLDNGIYSARAWDVGTTHNPMLATWSSRSKVTGVLMNHPGPMPFQLLAPFRRLLGPVGVHIGSALVNAGALGAAGWMGWRVGRRRGAVVFGGGALVLAASMGSAVLSDTWTHNLPLLALFTAAVAMWASFAGDAWAPVVTVIFAGLCAQISLAYIVLSAVLIAASLAAGVAWWWAERRGRAASHNSSRTAATARLRPLAVAIIALAALLALPAWEQFVAPDGPPGNVTAMIENADRLGAGRGPGFAVESFADIVLIPPAWAFADPLTWENSAGARFGAGASWAAFGVFTLLLIAALWWARRRRSRVLGAAVGATALLTATSLFTLASISETTLATAAYLRWLFPVGAFVTSAMALVALDAVLTLVTGTERLPQLARSAAGIATGLAVVVGLTVYSVDTHGLESGSPRWANEPAGQLHGLLRNAPAQLADRSPLLAVETPYTTSLVLYPAVLDEMLAAGVDLRFESGSPLLTQFGVGRTASGHEQWELSTRSGVAATAVGAEPNVKVLATTGIVDPAQFTDLVPRAEAIAKRIDASSFALRPGGSHTPQGQFFDGATLARVMYNPVGSLFNGTTFGLVKRNVVVLPDDLRADIAAFTADVDRRDHAFAVVVQPAGTKPPDDQGPVLALPGGKTESEPTQTDQPEKAP